MTIDNADQLPPRSEPKSSTNEARGIIQFEAAYLLPLSTVKPPEYDKLSSLRAKGFSDLASDTGGLKPKFEALAKGFEKIALLDGENSREVLKPFFPLDVQLDEYTRDLIMDLAFMRVRFDEITIGTGPMTIAVQQELQTILVKLGLVSNSQEVSDRPFEAKVPTLQDVIKYALGFDFDLYKLVEPIEAN